MCKVQSVHITWSENTAIFYIFGDLTGTSLPQILTVYRIVYIYILCILVGRSVQDVGLQIVTPSQSQPLRRRGTCSRASCHLAMASASQRRQPGLWPVHGAGRGMPLAGQASGRLQGKKKTGCERTSLLLGVLFLFCCPGRRHKMLRCPSLSRFLLMHVSVSNNSRDRLVASCGNPGTLPIQLSPFQLGLKLCI